MERSEFKAARLRAWSSYLENRSAANLDNLLRVYEPMVGYIAHERHRRYSHLDLDDVKQIGMIALAEAIERMKVQKVKSIDAWLSMVIKGRIDNHLGLSQNRYCAPLDEDMEASAVDDLSRIEIRTAIKALNPRERKVIYLRYWQGWQLKEIAEEMGCSLNNVVVCEREALNKLRYPVTVKESKLEMKCKAATARKEEKVRSIAARNEKIIAEVKKGRTQREVAEEFGMHLSSVGKLVRTGTTTVKKTTASGEVVNAPL